MKYITVLIGALILMGIVTGCSQPAPADDTATDTSGAAAADGTKGAGEPSSATASED